MKILFLHGWQSTPGGLKPTVLSDHGHEVLNPRLPDDDFDATVRIAQAEYDRGRPDDVVGSSRGGAVAMNINTGNTPLVLLCPAWKTWGTATSVKPNTVILHSQSDETVPIDDSRELLRNSGLTESALIVVGTEHRLADDESLQAILSGVEKNSGQETAAIAHESGPRLRFGIDTLLAITAMYAMLFGILRAFRASPLVFVVVGLLFTTVGLGQLFLFKGQRPQRASMVAGACFFVGLYVVYRVVFGDGYLYHPLAPFDPVEGAFVGAIFGYFAGLLIAGAFLVSDKLITGVALLLGKAGNAGNRPRRQG